MELTTYQQGPDSYVGRCKREADASLPSQFAAARVKTLAQCHSSSGSKKRKVGDNLTLELADELADSLDIEPSDLRTRLKQYTVMSNT